MPASSTRPVYFRSAEDLREWFAAHHATAREILVGYFKKGSGRPSVTYPQSVDEALCVGWIDGVRRGVDADRYVNRFSPRRAGSVWSAVNIRRARALIRSRRMRSAGLAAFAGRRADSGGLYSYEQRPRDLVEPYRTLLKRNRRAWAFFRAQPPGYRRTACWFIVSAKKEETRLARLRRLVKDSAAGRRLGRFERKTRR